METETISTCPTSTTPSATLLFCLEEARNYPPGLVMLIGPSGEIGRRWTVGKGDTLMGRSPELDICIPDRSVSKLHARLERSENRVYVTDLGSTNGTFLGSRRVLPNERRRIVDGEHLHLGSVIFKFLHAGNIENFSHQAAHNRAEKDPLTGALNKGALMRELDEGCRHFAALSRPLSFILFDLDDFKTVNDTHGHDVGDAVLCGVCNLIRQGVIRGTDALGRFGGDEFGVVLRDTPLFKAAEVAERIRALLNDHRFDVAREPLQVTASLGVAGLRPGDRGAGELFQKADRAAFLAKHGGKNRVSIS